MNKVSEHSHSQSLPGYKLNLGPLRNIALVLTLGLASLTALVWGYKQSGNLVPKHTVRAEERSQAFQGSWQQTVTEHLRHHEGLKLKPYQDTQGNWTIGYGHTQGVTSRTPRITKGLAEKLLENDVHHAITLASTHPCWPRSGRIRERGEDVRKAVLVNLVFNMGSGLWEFEDFKKQCMAGNQAVAAMSLLDSDWALQVGGRAQFLAEAWATGEWPDNENGDYKL